MIRSPNKCHDVAMADTGDGAGGGRTLGPVESASGSARPVMTRERRLR